MASMREMAKKNLDKMVKGAAREVNASRPAARSGATSTPTRAPATEAAPTAAPARAPGAEARKATPSTEVGKASASAEDGKTSSSTEVGNSSASAEAEKVSLSEVGKFSVSAEAAKTFPSAGTENPSSSAAVGKTSQTSDIRTPAAPAEGTKASGTKPTAVPPSVFDQLQAQIEKNGKTIQKVPIESIRLHENIREAYHEEHLKTLAESMQKDGLIQFPTLCLKSNANGEFSFVCKNGHRRILAAKSLGWKTIECVILPFASTRDELYHTIAANLREDVFFLDLAHAYQQANHLGEADQAIAARVGVNPRTVGWYRRLTSMAPECQTLCRQHPDLFHATWAIQLARKGELPSLAVLMKQMQLMLLRHEAQKNSDDQAPVPDRLPRTIDGEQQKEAKTSLKAIFSGARGPAEAQQAWQLVEQLCVAGYFKPALMNRLRRQLLPGAQKSSRRPSSSEA